MAKIIIKNFRAIDYAEIEIKPFTVIIGEQASGKSTISKLVYFFQTISKDVTKITSGYLLNKFSTDKTFIIENINFEQVREECLNFLKIELKQKFNDYFNSTKKEKFDIWFVDSYYSATIKPDNKSSISIDFIKNPFVSDIIRSSLLDFKSIADALEIAKLSSEKRVSIFEKVVKDINKIGDNKKNFIPASRSLITSILPAAQSKFIAEIDNRSEDNQVDYFVKTFLEDIDYYKRNYFFGKSLDEVIDEFELKTGKENPQAKLLRDKISTILKADYQHGNSGEVLVNKRFLKPVSLDKASSGQQEVVWILLTLLSLVLEDKQSFVVIEEPEAHLYPKTQAQVVEYIAQFFNAKEGNEVILTTHSPYILTVLNNLLFAKQISIKTHGVENQTIAESIDPNTWLDIDKFSAYYVGRNDDGQFIKSIINPETGLISVNALDDASDDIMDTFDNLMDIYKSAAV